MRTSYQDHYHLEESSTPPNVLVVETPAPQQEVDAEGEGEEVERAVEGREGEREKSAEEPEGSVCAGKERDGGEVTLESVEKEGDGEGHMAKDGEEGVQDEHEEQPHVRHCTCMSLVRSCHVHMYTHLLDIRIPLCIRKYVCMCAPCVSALPSVYTTYTHHIHTHTHTHTTHTLTQDASQVLPSIQTNPTLSTLPPSQPLHHPPPTLPRNISSSRR